MGKEIPIPEGNPFVAISAVLGGILLVIITLFLIFAKELIVTSIGTIVWGFVVLGIVMAVFASKAKKK